jgi:phage terminase small subunit
MPTPLKPSLLKELNGSFAKHPDRKRAREGEPVPNKPIGAPPKHLNDAQKALWKDFVKTVPAGVLGDCDKYAVEVLVVLLCEFRAGTIKSMGMTTMNSLLSRFGLTPSDRARVKASGTQQKEDDPWQVLISQPHS